MVIQVSDRDKEGEWTIEVTYVQMAQQIVYGKATVVYDSGGPADQQNPKLAEAPAPLLKIKTSARFGADDKLVRITESITDPRESAQQSPEMSAVLSDRKEREKTIRDLVEKAGEELPLNPVGPGDEWETTFKDEYPNIGEVEFKSHWRLVDIEEGPGGAIAVLAGTGQLKSTKEDKIHLGDDTMITKPGLRAQYTTSTRFNVEKGVKEMTASSIDSTVEGTQTDTEGKEIQIAFKVKGKTETILQKVKPAALVPAAEPYAP